MKKDAFIPKRVMFIPICKNCEYSENHGEGNYYCKILHDWFFWKHRCSAKNDESSKQLSFFDSEDFKLGDK